MCKTLFILLLGLFMSSQAFGLPTISSVSSGTVEHGDTITITGSGFDTKAPAAPLIWDTFESGQIHSNWSGFNGEYLIGSNSNRHPYSTKTLESDFQSQIEHHLMCKSEFTTDGKWFCQYWFKFAPNFKWGEGTYGQPDSALANVKFFRLFPEPRGPDGYYPNYVLAWHGFAHNTISVVEGSTPSGVGYFGMNPQNDVPINQWNSQEFEYKENSALDQDDGEIRYWLNSMLWLNNDTEMITSSTAQPYRKKYPFMVGFLASWQPTSQSTKMWLDDVYVDNSWARVMIGDNATWEQCAHREIQIPSAWSDTSITATINQGSFANGAQVYLYVVDANGSVNAQGYPITFGEAPGADLTPPFVTGQSPAPNAQNAPVNSSVVLHVQDSGDGVDVDSIQMQVNGQPVAPQITGIPSDHTVTYTPGSPFAYNSVVTVSVNAQDLHNAPNVMKQVTYSFTTQPGDSALPVVAGQSPAPDQQNVPVDTIIVLHVQDSGDGVDVDSIQMQVNGQSVTPQITGISSDYTVTYTPGSPFAYDSVVTVTVNAQDLHSPPNIINEVTYSFHTQPEGLITGEWGDGSASDHPGTVQDTFISNDENHSANATHLCTYTWPANSIANAILMKFDLPAIPQNATVISAKLRLYMFEAGNEPTYNISVHKIVNVAPVIAAATGYTYDGINPWTPYEGLDNNVPLGQSDIAAPEHTNAVDITPGYKEWTVTNIVSEWVADPSSNRGLLLNSDPNQVADAHRYFRPSEYADAAQRPRLVITYSLGNPSLPGPPGKPGHVE